MEIERSPYYVFDLSADGVLSFVWSASTGRMTDADFRAALLSYANHVAARGIRRCLIDVREFKHRPGFDVGAWRASEIVPLYHKGGVAKFAYVVADPADASPAASPGERRSGENFLTKSFADRAAAVGWLVA